MLERENIIGEIWKRLSEVSGVGFTARNPKEPPSTDNLPSLTFFELEDMIEEQRMRGGKPQYRRRLTLVIEAFVDGSTESLAVQELAAFVILMKAKLFADGSNLGGRCSEIVETESSRILRPETGGNVAGIGLAFDVKYVETIT